LFNDNIGQYFRYTINNANIMTYFQTGLRFKLARKELSLTQAEIADKLSVSVRTYARYERGEIDISLAAIMHFVHSGFSPNWLLTGIGEMKLTPLQEKEVVYQSLDRETLPPGYEEFENDVIDKLTMFKEALSQIEEVKSIISKMADDELQDS